MTEELISHEEYERRIAKRDEEIAHWKYQYKRASEAAIENATSEANCRKELDRWQKASDWLRDDWGKLSSTFGTSSEFGDSQIEVTCFRLEDGQGENRSFSGNTILEAIEKAMVAPSFTGGFLEEWEEQKNSKEDIARKLRFLLERFIETLSQGDDGRYYISAREFGLIHNAFNNIIGK